MVELCQVPQHPCQPSIVCPGTYQTHTEYGIPDECARVCVCVCVAWGIVTKCYQLYLQISKHIVTLLA